MVLGSFYGEFGLRDTETLFWLVRILGEYAGDAGMEFYIYVRKV